MQIFSRIFNNKKFEKKFFSQEGEDAVVMSFYEYAPLDYKGFYVDIRALHPVCFSNTKMFYDRGWRGINIDATPGSMEEFNEQRPLDINLEIGISENKEKLDFYSFKEPALNSFNKEHSEENIRNGWELETIVKVKTYTINEVLNKHVPKNQKIDFIDIDVEGAEVSLLKSLNFEKFAPKFFLIEELVFVGRDFTEYCKSEIYQILKLQGYVPVAKTNRTVIYIRDIED